MADLVTRLFRDSASPRAAGLLLCALFALAGCDEVTRSAFGGVIGVVGHPAIAAVEVQVYDALQFEGLDSGRGLIGSGVTNAGGRFSIPLTGDHLGRPLILVARPGPEARYRDFGAPGSPDRPFGAGREPWVGVLSEWRGGEAVAAVNPLTTMAFHSLMRLPATDVGGGVLRFDRNVVDGVTSAVGSSFGLRADPASELPAPPRGAEFEFLRLFYREDNERSTAYTYVCLQLARAANEFVAALGDPNLTALDFYEALYRDAADGVLDGARFGVPDPLLGQDPAVVGREPDGAGALLRWLSARPLSALDAAAAGAIRDGRFDLPVEEMLELQNASTGALRPTRVDEWDVFHYPYSGDVVLTLRGRGLRRTDRFVFRGFSNPNEQFFVERHHTGVDGEFLYHSETELRIRIPDFSQTSRAVPNSLRVPQGGDFRRVQFLLQGLPDVRATSGRIRSLLITDNARVTTRGEPLLVHAAVGRVDGAGGLTRADYADNLYDDPTDPAGLDPALDNVYELRVRVHNPGTFDVNGMSLDLLLSDFRQSGAPVNADLFGGSAPGRAVIWPDPLPAQDVPAGATRSFAFPFVFLDAAIPVDLALGVPVAFTPVLSGVSAGTGNPLVHTGEVIGLSRTVRIAPALSEAAPVLTAGTPVLPATVTAGESVVVELPLSALPLSGSLMRSTTVERVDVEVDLDGNSVVFPFTGAFLAETGPSGVTALRLEDEQGGRALPVLLSQAAPSGVLRLTLRTPLGASGALTVRATAFARDGATGAALTAASGAGSSTVIP
jgi:hypothetical protein